jgi:protein-S-isoprenylcysteine O-methyltransferase Ste14
MSVWNILFLIGFLCYLAIRGWFERRTRGKTVVWSRGGPADRYVLFVVFLGCLLLPVVYLVTPLLSFADYHLPLVVRCLGVLVMIAALGLFWRAHRDLDRNWSVTLEIRDGHELVTTGIYRRIRHPMYAAIWLFSLAQAMLLENWVAGPSAVASFAILYAKRVPNEERMMREYFGAAYDAYAANTGRLFPKLRKRP